MRSKSVWIALPALFIALAGVSATAAESEKIPPVKIDSGVAPATQPSPPVMAGSGQNGSTGNPGQSGGQGNAGQGGAAQGSSQPQVIYASDDNRYDGDRLKFKVIAKGFVPVHEEEGQDGKPNSGGKRCAPKGSKFAVLKQLGDDVYGRFYEIPEKEPRVLKFKENADQRSLNKCGRVSDQGGREQVNGNPVDTDTQYLIKRAELENYDFRRTGITFGGMVVPFKFHMGSDGGKLSSSATVAPYIGFRGPAPWGLSFTPVVSAGLALVPVTDADDQTSTKNALSTAVGVRLTSTKNDKFNAGLLFGKDFLSKSDRGADKYVHHVWFSLFVGVKL